MGAERLEVGSEAGVEASVRGRGREGGEEVGGSGLHRRAPMSGGAAWEKIVAVISKILGEERAGKGERVWGTQERLRCCRGTVRSVRVRRRRRRGVLGFTGPFMQTNGPFKCKVWWTSGSFFFFFTWNNSTRFLAKENF
jgi:hypothetical protein